ncbi:TRAP transporter small permease [Larsenimonas suaedae]|uniref:TRAP transporter small permease protein n=1 Tax=Larsenimonas suaedae TaxID=1851019 RepID=A0ABU1GVY4_9GAMM|nr:TRAP transporter small permease [Larsenimonas suaedae]MCM2973320.1 TRAP transporter small permease [Larsenimonas suaedae]MDR5896213.1 TRAP transporter small permease [Larsenimonas suaedae]
MIKPLLTRLAAGLALVGGLLLLGAIALSLTSMVGRRLWAAPITGDMELLQMTMAVAVACFLPLCEINDRHIRVDIVATVLPAGVNRALLVISHLMLACVSALLLWRTALMTQDSFLFNAQSVQLGLPEGAFQVAMLPGLTLMSVCALYQSVHHLIREDAPALIEEEGL